VLCITTGGEKSLQSISDNEERKITCIKNTFESPAKSEHNRSSSQTSSTHATSSVELGKPSTSTLTSSVNSDKLDNTQFHPICT